MVRPSYRPRPLAPLNGPTRPQTAAAPAIPGRAAETSLNVLSRSQVEVLNLAHLAQLRAGMCGELGEVAGKQRVTRGFVWRVGALLCRDAAPRCLDIAEGSHRLSAFARVLVRCASGLWAALRGGYRRGRGWNWGAREGDCRCQPLNNAAEPSHDLERTRELTGRRGVR